MPFIDPVDEFATAPRLTGRRAGATPTELTDLEVDDGYATLNDAMVGPDMVSDAVESLELVRCELKGTSLATGHVELELDNCELVDVDLSRVRIRNARNVVFRRCKLTGIDLSGSLVRDVVFDDCVVTYANVRLATFERVACTDGRWVDVDLYDASLTDVAFADTELAEVNIDRCRFDRVDLRAAAELGFTAAPSDLSGVLIADHQVQSLAHLFALASGASIERDG